MSTDSRSLRPVVRPLIDRFGFPQLLATTLVLVAATILLGVAAKATGSGLACEANWPQCDAGPYNLLPANLPSFYEWFHRFVAMFAGFAIVGSALAAWRLPTVDRRVARLVVLGMILTPIQVVLGRETVLQYEMTILSLHFWTAVLIFVLFVVATVLVWQSKLTSAHAVVALAVGVVALALHVALSPVVGTATVNYSPTMQLVQYGVTLTLLGSTIVAAMVVRDRFEDRLTVASALATPPLVVAVLFFGRRAVNPALEVPYLILAAVLLVAFLVSVRFVRSASSTRSNA
ncbi:cytochrome oxidase assembly protein [Natrarchaeobius oligotrophus]|uniref:Cytochrome oxidase assembly protein n=1 Tax=Natrarchaeobius chitinivorans TaxID=1679083 RepID=A0A3N6M4L2_NATCH|nr:cytochrome oxidase assembly protein [Natrarchaeobius chitinivorans]RQG98478.1 cytochrome oxidase assembly protein [Natrarchaeobius chitinivorans]